MDTKTYLLILLAAAVALAIAVFQYFYKQKGRSKIHIFLAFLRFLSLFLIFLLLINPTIENKIVETEKPRLAIAVDNSSSIGLLDNNTQVTDIVSALSNNTSLSDKFDIDFFSFNEDVNRLDSLNFSVNKTNIIATLQSLDNLYNTSDALILITDGNQTLGSDYSYFKAKPRINTVAIGDTIPHEDLKITKVNANRYSFLNNTFPVEIFINYNGKSKVSSNLTVSNGASIVFKRTISLNTDKNSERITFTTKADRVGALNYRVSLSPLSDEINKINNRTNFSVEVIDEQSNIAIISSITHPDLGMLKRSIESNKQRKVTLMEASKANNLNEYQLVILYQPDREFNKLFEYLNENLTNYFVITGTETDWNFLNTVQEDFSKSTINQSEEYQASRNTTYSSFVVDDIDFENLPPLVSTFGTAKFNVPYEIILYQTINNIETENALMATFSLNNRRGAVLFGEGIWKWRAYSYSNTKSFVDFDRFMNKLIQYLSIKKRLNRLDLDYQPIVYQNDNINISATYFNSNYTVDTRANLSVTIRKNKSNEVKSFPLRLSGQSYIGSISDLESGEYAFTVTVDGQNVKRSGSFTVLDYNIEQQFTYADVNSLKNLATTNGGSFYHNANFEELSRALLENDSYRPIQRSTMKRFTLIDWKWLLGFTALFLSLEWFIRKYYGKI
ncbi:MAG: VWA domain-containing protein [Flavobacteriaceae bacterium]|nr:VWA domain-containing protein [Flavobacteriaceae bacterium]